MFVVRGTLLWERNFRGNRLDNENIINTRINKDMEKKV
jgi:hypothetical protein